MYKGFRLLAPLDLASIDFQTRFKKEKEKKRGASCKFRSILHIWLLGFVNWLYTVGVRSSIQMLILFQRFEIFVIVRFAL